MNISEGFITRPIATSLLMAAIALFGLVVSQLLTLYLTPVVYTYMAKVLKTRKIPNVVATPATA